MILSKNSTGEQMNYEYNLQENEAKWSRGWLSKDIPKQLRLTILFHRRRTILVLFLHHFDILCSEFNFRYADERSDASREIQLKDENTCVILVGARNTA